MRRASITNEKMLKVWKLHEKGLDVKIIAETLDISAHSVSRIIKIMKAAQNGENVDSVESKGHQKQKDFAKRFFGIITEKGKEEVELEKQEDKQNSDDDSKDIMLKMLHMLAWQNELLEELLSELGVDWRNKCKGVERR